MDLCDGICGQTWLQLGICIVSVLEKGVFCKELSLWKNMSTVPEGLSRKGDENLSAGGIVRTAGDGNIC